MREEKYKFLEYLDKQEKLLKNDVNARIFSMVDQLQDIKNLENQFLEDQIIKKRQKIQTGDQDISKKSIRYDMEFKRKEILAKQAALNPWINLKKLIEMVPQFETLTEQQKRNVYSSIKIGQSQEQAKIELYKYENQPGETHQQIKFSQIRAQTYQNLLKQILPQEFREEYLSLKDIQNKRKAADKSFQKGINDFKLQVDQIQTIQYEISKNKNYLNDYKLIEDSLQYLVPQNQQTVDMLIPYNEFQKKIKKIGEIKDSLDKMKQVQDNQILESDRILQKQNNSCQVSAEQDAEQQKNLLLLLQNYKTELGQKMKIKQVESADRNSKTEEDAIILFTQQEIQALDKPITFEQQQEELLELLKKYKVDLNWLREQQLLPLQKIMDEKNKKLYQRAVQIENNILLKEKQNIISLINKKNSSKEIKQYLLNKLKSQTFSEGIDGYFGGDYQLLDQAIIAQIENQLDHKDYDVTEFIFNKLQKLEAEKQQLKQPTISKLDVSNDKIFRSAHEKDNRKENEILDFEKYKFRQMRKIHQLELEKQFDIIDTNSLFQQMTRQKQRAWYNIYNDYLNNQNDQQIELNQSQEKNFPNQILHNKITENQDFFEQFKNWEFKAFLKEGNFEEREIKNIKKTLEYLQNSEQLKRMRNELGQEENEDLEIEEPNIAAAMQEMYSIIRKNTYPALSVRNDESYLINENDPSQFEKIQQIIFHSEIQDSEEILLEFKQNLLEDNQIFSIYDKVEDNKKHTQQVKKYEEALKDLNNAKKEFVKQYGINFYNFNPVEIQIEEESIDSHKNIIEKPIIEQQYYVQDMKFVDDIIEQAYKEQFPKDPNIEKYFENMPKLILSEENREKIKKHAYNEEIQEQYYNAINYKPSIADDPKNAIRQLLYEQIKEEVKQNSDVDVTEGNIFKVEKVKYIRKGKDLDDELIKRIDFHLNEKYQSNIKVVDTLQMPTDVQNQEQYDIQTFEDLLQESPQYGLSEYQQQQFLLQRLRHKQQQVNQGLKLRNQQIDKLNESKLQDLYLRNKENQEETDLETKHQEKKEIKFYNIEQIRAALQIYDDINNLVIPIDNQQKEETDKNLEVISKDQQQKEIKYDYNISQDTLVTEKKEQNPSKKQQQNLIKIKLDELLKNKFVQNDSELKQIIKDIIQYKQSQEDKQAQKVINNKNLTELQAQKQKLKEEIEREEDPIYKSLNNLIQERSKLNRKLHANTQQVLQDYIYVDHFETQKIQKSQVDYNDLLDNHYKFQGQEQQEQKMQQMADLFQQFDLALVEGGYQVPQVAYTGESIKSKDNVSNFINAYSSEQIIQAAKSQNLSPQQQKLALLYDPFNPIREQYLRTKYQMYINKKLRQDLATKILQAQNFLNNTLQSKQNFEKDAQKIIDRFSGQILPKKVYDFINIQNIEQEKIKQREQKLQVEDIIKSINKFDPFSQDIQTFNDQLRLQLTILRETNEQNKTKKYENDIQLEVEYIIKQLKQNNLKADIQTYSLLFQINLEQHEIEKSNQNLKRILTEENKRLTNSISQIDVESLKKFCEISISEDNFDGLSHLISYLEMKNIDISKWNMTSFRSAVDFYLNHSFNINNIFTFTRFYVHHANCCLSLNQNIQQHLQNLEEKSPEILAVVHKEIFGQLENIVDMNLLFQLLVNKLGNKTLLDPISKIDPMQNIIDFFSKKEIQAVQKYSDLSSTFINDDDISQYYTNNLSNPEIFQRVFDQVFKFNNNQYFISNIIKALRDHIAVNEKLPKSFQNIEKIKKQYLQIKNAIEENKNNQKLSEKSAEFLLFVFKSNKMTAESIDLTQNFHNLVEGYENKEQVQKQSNIRNYYMSEALLQLDIEKQSKSYYKLVHEAVFNNQDENSEAFLSSMVKAYMLDGSVDYALQFFNNGFNQRKSNYEKQEEMLINLFDSTFGNLVKSQEDKKVSLNEFKNRYLNLVQARDKLKKEAKLLQQLQKVLNNCDPEEIDCLFMLQAILREERLILMKLVDMSQKDFYYVQDQYDKCSLDQDNINDFVKNLSQKYSKEPIETIIDRDLKSKAIKEKKFIQKVQKELFSLKQRKNLLESKVQNKSKEQIMKILKKYKDQQVEILDNVNNVEQVLQTLGIDQEQETDFEKYEKQKEEIEQVVELMKLESEMGPQIVDERINQSIMQAFKESVKLSTDSTVNAVEKERVDSDVYETLFQKFDDKYGTFNILNLIQRGFYNKKGHLDDPYEKIYINQFFRELYEEPPEENDKEDEDETESIILKNQIYDFNVKSFQDELRLVLESRRANQLPFAIKTFNKIQNKQMPLWLSSENEINSQINLQSLQKEDLYQNREIDLDYKEAIQLEEQNVPILDYYDFQNQKAVIGFNDDKVQSQQYLLFNSKLKDPKLINQTIQRYKYLLNDYSSPIISNFLYLIDYRDGRDIIDYQEFYEQHKTGQANNLLVKYMKQSEQLITLGDEIDKMISVANDMQEVIQNHHIEFVNEIESAQKFKTSFTQQREQSLQNLINQNIQELYQQFTSEQEISIENTTKNQQDVEQNSSDQQVEDQQQLLQKQFSREQKIQIMKQALSLELGGFKQYEIFNPFFAEDFIVFGIQNNIAEAVRLGEYLLSEGQQKVSQDLKTALINYKLKFSEKYSDAMKRTGPINISNIYREVYRADPSSENYTKSSIINADDPYWQEFIDRNYRAQDRYKIPSAMAWDHKDDGIFGEIINIKELENKKLLFDKLL